MKSCSYILYFTNGQNSSNQTDSAVLKNKTESTFSMCSIQIFTPLPTKTQLRARLATWLGTITNFFAQTKKSTEIDI